MNRGHRWHRWAEAHLDQAVEPRRIDRPDGEATVWRLDAAGRAVAYLKQHRVRDKWRRERAILDRLAEPPGAPTPALLADDPQALALLLAPLPGTPASTTRLDLGQRRSLHEQAGRFRRRLDAIAVDEPDPTPVATAIEHRRWAWCERARPYLPSAVLHRVERAVRPECFEGVTRRWCHRDLAPHNWVVDPSPHGARLGILDFGQARPDVWLVDALKLWDGAWVEHPTLGDAFWAGYGRPPDAQERQQLIQLGLLHGLATATWGDRHDDPALSSHGRSVLHRALEELES